MSKYKIYGGRNLEGSIRVATSKNATLPILAGAILSEKEVILNNLPKFSDIENMQKILKHIGCKILHSDEKTIINTENLSTYFIPNLLTKGIRSSIFMLGPMLAKFKKAKISFPGGCNIGNRPIDLHLKGLRALNCNIIEEHGYLDCDGQNMKPADIHLDFPSVGATENIMMAAVKLDGRTRIFNAAREPEIVDLQNFLNKMGAKITGAGDSIINIEGVKSFSRFVSYTPISDRIIAGTYLLAGLICGGNVEICNINPEHIYSLISKLKNSACNLTIKNDKISLKVNSQISAMNVETNPYPGFPTDLQPQLVSLLSCAKGTSVVTENMFETRFKHIPELIKMGAKITVKDKLAIINGVESLSGAEVCATDLRAGAALVLAGLKANGYTIVDDIFHINRGYENLMEELNSLNANIKLIDWYEKK